MIDSVRRARRLAQPPAPRQHHREAEKMLQEGAGGPRERRRLLRPQARFDRRRDVVDEPPDAAVRQQESEHSHDRKRHDQVSDARRRSPAPSLPHRRAAHALVRHAEGQVAHHVHDDGQVDRALRRQMRQHPLAEPEVADQDRDEEELDAIVALGDVRRTHRSGRADPAGGQGHLHEHEGEDADDGERIVRRHRPGGECDQGEGADRQHPERGARHRAPRRDPHRSLRCALMKWIVVAASAAAVTAKAIRLPSAIPCSR